MLSSSYLRRCSMILQNFQEVIALWQEVSVATSKSMAAEKLADYLLKQPGVSSRSRVVITNDPELQILTRIYTRDKIYAGMLTELSFNLQKDKPSVSFTLYGPKVLRVDKLTLSEFLDILFWPNPVDGIAYVLQEGPDGPTLHARPSVCKCQLPQPD